MHYEPDKAIQILERTPKVLNNLLLNIDDQWVLNNEGENTWSPFDIIGHLIHGEKTDWIPRAKIILEHGSDRTFEPFDRFAQYEISKGKIISELLHEFETLRKQNLYELKSLNISNNLNKKGMHPELGEVSLKNLLSCWVVHDLGHISQVARVMAKQYKNEVGIWTSYLGILN